MIDPVNLPTPTIIDQLDYETILQHWKNDLIEKDSDLEDVLGNESEPLTLYCEVGAYRELVLRQQFNDRAKKVLITEATETDLDHIGISYFAAKRLLIDADTSTYETDDAYRTRLLLDIDSHTTAGSEESYKYHALSADGQVKDVDIASPNPSEILITVLSHVGDGTSDAALLTAVNTACSSSSIRPLADQVTVQGATINNYNLNITFYTYPGADSAALHLGITTALSTYTNQQHALGRDITLAGLAHATMLSGVQNVAFNAPGLVADRVNTNTQAGYCTGITINYGGVAE